MATKQPYKKYRVNTLPESDLIAGDIYYLNVGSNKFTTYIVGDDLEFYEAKSGEQPDEEDLTSIEGVIKFKDRDSDIEGEELGYIYLRSNTGGISDLEEQIKSNSIVEIIYKYNLGGETLELPENVTLKFNGGFLFNGTIKGNNTKIEANSLNRIFGDDVFFTGKFTLSTVYPEWFGAIGYLINQSGSDYWWSLSNTLTNGLVDGVDSTIAINKAIQLSYLGGGRASLENGAYKITDTIYINRYQRLNIDSNSAIRAFMQGEGNIVVTQDKDSVTNTIQTFPNAQVALYSNQYFHTSCMKKAIHLSSGGEITGKGTLTIATSEYTIGVYVYGDPFSTIDMIFNTRADIKIIGGSTNRCAPAPYDYMMDGWDNNIGEIEDYGFDTQTGRIHRKTGSGWTAFFANKSEYNTLIRQECDTNDRRLINFKGSIWGILAFRGLEMVATNGGWNNQSVWEGTISNITNGFINIFGGSAQGMSVHDMRTMTYQIGNKNSPESRVIAMFGICGGFHFGNTWDLTWFRPARITKSYEIGSQVRDITIPPDLGTDGLEAYDFRGSTERMDITALAYNRTLNAIGDVNTNSYRNLFKYHDGTGITGLTGVRTRRFMSFIKPEDITPSTIVDNKDELFSNYSAQDVIDGTVIEVPKVIFDEDLQTMTPVIDTSNDLYGVMFPLWRVNDREVGDFVILFEFLVDNNFNEEAYVEVFNGSGAPHPIVYPIVPNRDTTTVNTNRIVRVFVNYSRMRRDIRNTGIYIYTKSESCKVDLINLKVYSNAGQSIYDNTKKGTTVQRLNAAPKGYLYYNTQLEKLQVNIGNSTEPIWANIQLEE